MSGLIPESLGNEYSRHATKQPVLVAQDFLSRSDGGDGGIDGEVPGILR